jgi:cytochrome bd-type quinol oxidase subunit 2
LLIIAGLAGLRGAVGALRWDGPLHQEALVVGVVLEVVIVTMLVILLIRRRSGSQEATAVKLRGVLLSVLGAGGVAAAVLMVASLHLHVFSQGTRPRPRRAPGARPSVSTRPRLGPGAAPHISLTVLLYALLVGLLLAGIAVCIWLARRLRPPTARRGDGDDFIVEDAATPTGASWCTARSPARASITASSGRCSSTC